MWSSLKNLFKWAFSPEMSAGWRFITVLIFCATIGGLGFLYKEHVLYFGPAGIAPQEVQQYPIVNRAAKSDSLIDHSTIVKKGFEDLQPRNQVYANVPIPRPREKRNYYQYYIEQGEGDPEVHLKIFECGRDGWPTDCDLTSDAERLAEARKKLMKAR